MNQLNADEARRISKENNSDFVLDNILEMVKESALKGEFNLKVRKYGFSDASFYSSNPYPKKIKDVIDNLIKLGFRASIRVEERQFVDIYLLIEWGEVSQ